MGALNPVLSGAENAMRSVIESTGRAIGIEPMERTPLTRRPLRGSVNADHASSSQQSHMRAYREVSLSC